MIKRSASSSPALSSSSQITPTKNTKLTTPRKATAKTEPATPSYTFDNVGRGQFLDEVIAAGAKAVNLDELAVKYGVKKSQLVDQLKPNRSNVRSKAVKAVQEQ